MAYGIRKHVIVVFMGAAVACSQSDDSSSLPGMAFGPSPGGTAPATPSTCGNGVLDADEFCEGTTAETCASATVNARPYGVVFCSPACTLDITGCRSTPGNAGLGGNGAMMGAGGAPGGTGGATAGAGGTTPGAGGLTDASTTDDPFAMLRQACVDTINAYRATLGLDPLSRATPEQEACSDEGAELDSVTQPHNSSGECPGLGAQNTCPGWGTNGGELNALTNCLQSMWEEGEPPVSREECEDDFEGCFRFYGHYLNMSNPSAQVVSCGFYRMPDDEIWMNQDFGG